MLNIQHCLRGPPAASVHSLTCLWIECISCVSPIGLSFEWTVVSIVITQCVLHLPDRPKTMELWSGLALLWSAWSIYWTGKWWYRYLLPSWLKWGGAAERDFHSWILSLIFRLEASGFPQTLQANVGNVLMLVIEGMMSSGV